MRPAARFTLGAVVGGSLGAAVLGPVGAAIGAGLGAMFAHWLSPAATEGQKQTAAAALVSTATPSELRAMARALDSAGLGQPLRVRANLLEHPDPDNRSTLRTAALSTDPVVVTQAAKALQHKGAHATGQLLRDYARGLRALQAAKPEATKTIVSAVAVGPSRAAPRPDASVTRLSDRRQA